MTPTTLRAAAALRAEAAYLDRCRWLDRAETTALARRLRALSGDLGGGHTRSSAALYHMTVGLGGRLAVRQAELADLAACLARHADRISPAIQAEGDAA